MVGALVIGLLAGWDCLTAGGSVLVGAAARQDARVGQTRRASHRRRSLKLALDLLERNGFAARDLVAREPDGTLVLFGDRLVVKRRLVEELGERVPALAAGEVAERVGGLGLGKASIALRSCSLAVIAAEKR